MRLGEEISRLMKSGDSMKKDRVLMKIMLYKMSINLYMFDSFMKGIIVSNMRGTCFVTVLGSRSTEENPHISK